jgi:hypothetical protein
MNQKYTIIEKSSKLFLKNGVHVISMDDISSNCNISKKTIYKYFLNKDDLVNEVICYQIKEIELQLNICTINSLNSIIELNCFFNILKTFILTISPTFYKDLKTSYPNIYKKLLNFIESDIVPFLQQNILRGKKENFYKFDLKSKYLSQSYNLIYQILISDNFFKNIEKNKGAIDFLNALYLHRLVSIKGLKFLNS